MKLNLDSLRAEIETNLQDQGFSIFHGFSRHSHDFGLVPIEWDTAQYPDFRAFLKVAKDLGVKVIGLHHRQFSADVIEDALESLADMPYEIEDRRDLERRLRELSVYEGFTCAVELAFDYDNNLYLFDLQADWYRELHDLLDEATLGGDEDSEDEDDPLGGYYSKN